MNCTKKGRFGKIADAFQGTNATGVYSGVVASGNGNEADTTNLDNTFARGVQATDDEGVVSFDTNVPGHYTGRTNHIHVMV